LPRLYVEQVLAEGASLTVEGPQAHYLGAVMRLGEGDRVKLFDDRTGEWLAAIEEAGKKRITLHVGERLREREAVPDLWLLFAPIKRGRIDWLVEKATELGVARLVPVVTGRTIVDRLNRDRLLAHAVEAAEQCERTALPELAEAQRLDTMLRAWLPQRTLLFADEAGGTPLAEAAAPGPAAILIGPEGGFTDDERKAIRALPSALGVSLGPRILRADTAAVAAVSVWMAAAGDWHRHADR
jgi:16S rRNA (uracil1498-N3)-methyltransferase